MPYLLTRRSRLAPGNVMDAMAWSVKITEKVNAISEVPVSLWTTVFSPKLGVLSWTTVVDDLSQLEALDAKLMADGGYIALVEEGARFTSDDGIDDAVVHLVHADADGAGGGQYATVVQAVVTPGSFVKGVELGVQIAQEAKKITGRPTSFGTSLTGPYGEVGWIALYDSVDQLQAASLALNTNLDFGQLLDKEASKAYLAGASSQTAWRRVV
jgi:hypothetical protein